MRITGLCPLIVTNDPESVVKLFEAYDFLIAHGFTDPRGNKVTETSSSVATMLFSPSGFPVTISEHIRALEYQEQLDLSE